MNDNNGSQEVNFLDIIKNARKKSTGAAPPVIQNAAPARTSTEPKTINLLPKLANKEQVVDLNSYKLNAYAQNPTQQKAQSLGTYLSPEAQALKTSGGRPKISFDNFESAQEDTLTQRKIPPSRLSNPTSSSGARLSSGPTYNVQKKKPSDGSENVNEILTIVLIGIAVCFALVSGYSLLKYLLTPPFCSPFENPSVKWCKECPPHGICRDGKLIECEGKQYISNGKECVIDGSIEELANKTYTYLDTFLARQAGSKLCNQSAQTVFTEPEIENIIMEHFPSRKNEISERFDLIKDKWVELDSRDSNFSIGIARHCNRNISPRVEAPSGCRYTSTRVEIPFGCSCRLFYRAHHKLIIFLSIISLLLVTLLAYYKHLSWYKQKAEDIYTSIIDTLQTSDRVCVKTLYNDYKPNFTPSQYKRVWSMVEDFRQNDQRIFQYEDSYGGAPEKFWVMEEKLSFQ